MALASLRTISIFLIHVFRVCVKIAAQGLNTLPHAEGTCAGGLCRLHCCSPGPAEHLCPRSQETNSRAAGQKLLGDFRHPCGALPKCQVSPSLGSRACLRPLLVPLGVQVQGDNITARSPPQHALERGKDFPGTREPGAPSWMGANDQICSLCQDLACT